MDFFSSEPNARGEAALANLLHALQTELVSFVGLHICAVLIGFSGAQVLPSIVHSVSIPVVNLMLWPFAFHVEIGEAVGQITPMHHVQRYIEFAALVTQLPASPSARFLVACPDKPSKMASLRIIMQQLEQPLMGKRFTAKLQLVLVVQFT